MLPALTTPVFRSVMVGGLMLALGGAAYVRHHEHRTVRLALHTEWRDNAVYLTAWEDGHDVSVDMPGKDLLAFKFIITARISDGCRWRGTETLTPVDDKTYAYAYSEEILSCSPGATPAIKTPRLGTATVVE